MVQIKPIPLLLQSISTCMIELFLLLFCKNTGWNKPRQPWMTTALLKSCKKKSRLYKKYLANPTNHNKQDFTRYRNKFKAVRLESEALIILNVLLNVLIILIKR